MTLCFFGFFRAGQLTVPGTGTFDPANHLAWGDVAMSTDQPPVIRVFLKRSKTDQYGLGVTVYVEATGNNLCPARAVTEYVARRGDAAGALFGGWKTTVQEPVCSPCATGAESGRGQNAP